MTFVPLSAIRPRDGQAVIYRLRPNGVQVPATYDHAGPAWVLEGGHRQTARAHHQWTPAPGAAQRFCKHCGERLVRKRVGRRKAQWESPKVFAGRDYCDRACSDAARRKDRSEEKPCAVCGQPARRRKGESSQKWAERQTCSRQCGAIHRGRKFGAAERSRIAERGWETRQAQEASEPRPAPRPRPQAPRPRPERPKPLPQAQAAPRRKPVRRGEFDPAPKASGLIAPEQLAQRHEPIRMLELGEPCDKHPSYRKNVFGQCAACVAGGRWAERERQTAMRPHPEGGR